MLHICSQHHCSVNFLNGSMRDFLIRKLQSMIALLLQSLLASTGFFCLLCFENVLFRKYTHLGYGAILRFRLEFHFHLLGSDWSKKHVSTLLSLTHKCWGVFFISYPRLCFWGAITGNQGLCQLCDQGWLWAVDLIQTLVQKILKD